MNVLIAYGTTDGHTARIADRLALTARIAGHHVTLVDTRAVPHDLDLASFDAVLIGASRHMQGFQRSVSRFVKKHLDALRARPSAFYSVCLSIASKNAAERVAARRIAEQWPTSIGWLPERIAIFAGALKPSRYGLIRRHALPAVAKRQLGTRDLVFTDWEQVEEFARSFLAESAKPRRRAA